MKLWRWTAPARRRTPASPSRVDPEAVAYVTIERARRRVQQLRDRTPAVARAQLEAVARELGMVGYFISENLVSEARRELLAQARASCRVAIAGPDEARAELSDLLADVERELERAILLPELSPHLVQAADHLAEARELLGEALGERVAHTAASTD